MLIKNTIIAKLSLAALLASAATFGVTAAYAGQCPADQVTANDAEGQKPGPAEHIGVTAKVLGSVNLAKEKVALPGYLLRSRELIVAPGGVVAWHSHAERPAVIHIVSGTITEYSSRCKVPIVHNSGDTSLESGGLSHWWKNSGDTPVRIFTGDIAQDENAPHM